MIFTGREAGDEGGSTEVEISSQEEVEELEGHDSASVRGDPSGIVQLRPHLEQIERTFSG